jgi:eukaryotic-like serine/threonine-protein kinase
VVGRTIKQYTIVEKLGEGGMGVVYKARDTRLDRFVAIKTLPPKVVADAARKQRFIQEAKAASALSHPSIIHIYDIDSADGVEFISMEFVPGKTLDRLNLHNGIKFPEALKYGVQIAGALAAAHSAGIIHRDLKPGNVMVNEQGLVKVLDFGLAKLIGPGRSAQDSATGTVGPTVTQEGTIVGTVAYMSPEQAEGKTVDARSDIFSLGSVLYEMLTGRRAFQGDTTASTIAAILRDDPKPASDLVAGLPGEIQRILKRCMRKDPAQRFQHMDDLKVALEELKQESDSGLLGLAAAKPRGRRMLPVAATLAVAAVATAAGALWFSRFNGSAREPELISLPLTTYPGYEHSPSFSPDGNQVAFTWCKEDESCHIYIKQIGVEPPSRLTVDTAAEFEPSWSADGRFLAFFKESSASKFTLVIVPQRGGRERVIAEIDFKGMAGIDAPLIAWTPDSKWIALAEPEKQVWTVFLHSIDTGERKRLISPRTEIMDGTTGDISPAFSPDGRALVFSRRSRRSDIYIVPLGAGYTPTGEPERLRIDASFNTSPVWLPNGREIVFLSGTETEGGLWRINVSGSPNPRRFGFADRKVFTPAVSANAHRLAYSQVTADENIWRLDLAAGEPPVAKQFIASTRGENQPAYSPNGKRVAFVSDRSGHYELWVCDADGSTPTQLTSFQAGMIVGPRWSWDSENIAFFLTQEETQIAYTVSPNGGGPRRFAAVPRGGKWPYWSRDGRWVYFATEGQKAGIWRVNSGGSPTQITQDGGDVPQESPDSKFVYYSKGWPNQLSVWSVSVDGGEPKKLFESVHPSSVWTVTEKGIVFARLLSGEKPRSDVSLYEFATGRIRTVSTLSIGVSFLSSSPDGRYLLYSKGTSNSDLMLVDNFQ